MLFKNILAVAALAFTASAAPVPQDQDAFAKALANLFSGNQAQAQGNSAFEDWLKNNNLNGLFNGNTAKDNGNGNTIPILSGNSAFSGNSFGGSSSGGSGYHPTPAPAPAPAPAPSTGGDDGYSKA